MARYIIESTWADSFGIWHARVRDADYWLHEGQRFNDSEWRSLTRAARKAIVDEITQREESPTRSAAAIKAGVRIEYAPGLGRVSGQTAYVGRPESVVFREQTRPEHFYTPVSAAGRARLRSSESSRS